MKRDISTEKLQFIFHSEATMSAVHLRFCLRFLPILCLCISQALCNQESSSVIWTNTGQSVTIQCRSSASDLQNISLKKGIHRETDISFKHKTGTITIADNIKDRMQLNGNFPNLDFLLKNLTSDDTGVYWCLYKEFDAKSGTTAVIEGQGSVLLVVTDPTGEVDKSTAPDCDQPNKELVLTSVVISSAVLLTII